jgi:lysine 2,3-aminomutase
MPHLVLDAPGGGGKVPIFPNYIVSSNHEEVMVRNYRGLLVSYPQPKQRDCNVAYDDVYFVGRDVDDDREGSVESNVEDSADDLGS